MTDHRNHGGPEGTDLHALSGAYAVDALDDAERTRFEEHLRHCADCRNEVAELQETAAVLGLDRATAPPESLRALVLADIDTVRPLPPVVAPAVALPSRRRWLSRPVLAAASVVAVLALAATAWWGPLRDDTAPPSASDQVLTTSDATRVTKEMGSGASATVVLSRELGRAVIVTERMTPPPTGSFYTLWLQTPSGDMEPAGTLPDEPDSVVLLKGDATHATAVGITVEPDPRAKAPTSAPIALFALKGA